MCSPESQPHLAVRRKIEIGRVTIHGVSGTMMHGVAAKAGALPDVRRHDPPYLLAVSTGAGLRYSHMGRAEHVGGRDYVLLTQKAPFELEVENGGEALLVSLPAGDLKGKVASVEDHAGRRFEPNRHMTRLLVDFLHGVAEIVADGYLQNSEALATEIVSLVALTLCAEDRGAVIDVRNGRYQLRRRIFEFVESNLGDQDLSPKKIAASSRISLSYLYSLFNDDNTTVGQFVQGKRLQRAYEMLVADPFGRRTVSEVAYEVGFKNVSHFSRCFSRHFMVAPRDARQTGRLPEQRHGHAASLEGGIPAHATGLRQAKVARASAFG